MLWELIDDSMETIAAIAGILSFVLSLLLMCFFLLFTLGFGPMGIYTWRLSFFALAGSIAVAYYSITRVSFPLLRYSGLTDRLHDYFGL